MNTVMSKFSQQFKDIADITQYKVVTLNKATGTIHRNEVESDHIRIYKINNYSSFAFAFHNIDSDLPYIMATLKFNENISSAKYSPLALKEKLKEYINILKILKETKQLNEKSAFSSFDTLFIKPKMEESIKEINEIEIKLQKHIEDSIKNFQKDIKQNKKLIKEINLAENELKEKYAKKIVELGIPELKKELRERELKAKQYLHDEKAKLKIDETKENQRKLEKSLYSLKHSISIDMEKILSTLPKAHTKKIRDIFNEKLKDIFSSIYN